MGGLVPRGSGTYAPDANKSFIANVLSLFSLVAEEVLHELLGRGFRSEVRVGLGLYGLSGSPFLALLDLNGAGIGARFLLGLGLSGRLAGRLLVGGGRLTAWLLIAQKLAEALDSALL